MCKYCSNQIYIRSDYGVILEGGTERDTAFLLEKLTVEVRTINAANCTMYKDEQETAIALSKIGVLLEKLMHHCAR